MNPNRFDQISRYFNQRRVSRRAALTQGAGLAAGAAAMTGFGSVMAQDATPDATPNITPVMSENDETVNLFVQSFKSGSIALSETKFGTHTMTLEQGMGQTIVFADRPSREVSVAPTPAFLDGLSFDPGNPPNAAMIMDIGNGDLDLAVVELFNPSYDEATRTATYDVSVLANWQNNLELGFHEFPTELADLSEKFGATHVFIDSCGYGTVGCYIPTDDPYSNGTRVAGFTGVAQCWWFSRFSCQTCVPSDASTYEEVARYWTGMCNETYPTECENRCQGVA